MTAPSQGRQPEILSVRTAARSRLFHIEAVELRFANGTVREFERVAGSATPGAVIIVPLLDADNLLLVREYAVGVERYELSLPMGHVQHQESAVQAANRELMEETGYGARNLKPLHTLALAPGILSYRMEVVLATGLYSASRDGDEPEPLEVVEWPVDRIDELPISGEITDARTLAALFIARKALMRGKHEAAVKRRAVFIVNPHNPSGTVTDNNTLRSFVSERGRAPGSRHRR